MSNTSKEPREIKIARAKVAATFKTIRLILFVHGTFALITATLMALVLGSMFHLNMPLVFAGSLFGLAVLLAARVNIKSIWASSFATACQAEKLWDDAENTALDGALESINEILDGKYPSNPAPGLRLRVAQMQVVLIRKGEMKNAAKLAEYLYRESPSENKSYQANGLGCILVELGKYDRGFEILESALTQVEAGDRSNSPAHVTALIGLAQANINLERLDKAESLLKRLKASTEACQSEAGKTVTDRYVKMSAADSGIEMAFYWFFLGQAQKLRGNEEAEASLQRAADIMKAPALRTKLVLFYPEIMLTTGLFALANKDYIKAEKQAKEAITIYEEETPSKGTDYVRSQALLAYARFKQGHSEPFAEELSRCLERFKELLYEPHPTIATCEAQLAEVYASQGQNDKAREYFEHALATRKKLLPENSPRIKEVEEQLAQLPAGETAAIT